MRLWQCGGSAFLHMSDAEVAQLVEQLIRNQQVTGSSPVFGLSVYFTSNHLGFDDLNGALTCSAFRHHFFRLLCLGFNGVRVAGVNEKAVLSGMI
jgi:hypothetical protein